MKLSKEDFAEIRNDVNRYLYRYLLDHVEKRGKYFVCPACGSNDGFRFTKKEKSRECPEKWICYACSAGGSVVDAIKHHEGIGSDFDALKRAVLLYGSPDSKAKLGLTGYTSAPTVPATARPFNERQEADDSDDSPEDFTAFFEEARKHIGETDYPQRRGLSEETVERFGLGFAPAWRHPKVSANVPLTPRLIVPTSRYGYLARDTRPNLTEEQKRYCKPKAGRVRLFNSKVLTGTEPVFVTEGEIDALSIEEVGGRAVGLGSTAMKDKFLNRIFTMKREDVPCLILCLDNDKAGDGTQPYIVEKLQSRGYRVIARNICMGEKDPNDALRRDREGFGMSVREAIQEAVKTPIRPFNEVSGFGDSTTPETASASEPFADVPQITESEEAMTNENEQQATVPATTGDGQKPKQKPLTQAQKKKLARIEERGTHSALAQLASLRGSMYAGGQKPIPTGFEAFDKALTGGLRMGLYVFGAVSSLGKTTFLLQLCDQIAQMQGEEGRDILYYSLEMSRHEMMAKSLSRHSFLNARKVLRAKQENKQKDIVPIRLLAVRQTEILEGYKELQEQQKPCLEEAYEQYEEYAGHVFFEEAENGLTVASIWQDVEDQLEWRKAQGWEAVPPIVVVDYLQLLDPPYGAERMSDKQITDKNMKKLRQLARHFGLPVVCISSLNRASYWTEVSIDSFKESGAIEFSSDALIGLQFEGIGDLEGTDAEKKKKAKELRKVDNVGKRGVEMVILKQRCGEAPITLSLNNYPAYNFFEEKPKGNR